MGSDGDGARIEVEGWRIAIDGLCKMVVDEGGVGRVYSPFSYPDATLVMVQGLLLLLSVLLEATAAV